MNGSRLTFVDSLRGVAATAVVATHVLYGSPLEKPLTSAVPSQLRWVMNRGGTGVQAFFVLSGFVIVLSVARLVPTLREARLFALRRQLRLDPPYWAMMAIVLVLGVAERAMGFVTDSFPSAVDIVANAFYVQRLFGRPEVVGVAWTLCIEIQFYLFVLILLFVARGVARRARHEGGAISSPLLVPLLLATAAASLAVASLCGRPWSGRLGILFFEYWHYFVLGALACLAWLRRCSWKLGGALGVLAVAVALVVPAQLAPADAIVGLCTFVVLQTSIRLPTFGARLGSVRLLQYLGSRSYSIYLVHLSVLRLVMRSGYKVTDDSPAAALAWMTLALMVSLLAAELLHRLVERPALRFSSVVKDRGLPAALAGAHHRLRSGRSAGRRPPAPSPIP